MLQRRGLQLTLLSILILIMAACAPAAPAGDAAAPEPEAADAADEPAAEEASSEDAEGGYKIGVVMAETGGASSLGVPEANTARMMAAQLEESGGVTGPDGVQHPVEIIIYDSESNPDVAASAISRLILEDEVDVLVAGRERGRDDLYGFGWRHHQRPRDRRSSGVDFQDAADQRPRWSLAYGIFCCSGYL